jgi:chlorite dismutase
VTGEASPYYLFHPAVPERLHADLPDARWIVLWDPVTRALSWYHPRRSCWRVTLEGIVRQD